MIIHYYPLLETIRDYYTLYTIIHYTLINEVFFRIWDSQQLYIARRAADVMWDCRKQICGINPSLVVSCWYPHDDHIKLSHDIPWAWFVIRWLVVDVMESWLMSDVYWKKKWKTDDEVVASRPDPAGGPVCWNVRQEIPAEHAVKLLEARSSFPAICHQQFVLAGFEYKQNHTRSVWAYLFGVSKPP